MRKEEVKMLDDILTLEDGSTSFRKQDISGEIIDSEYVTEDFRPPTRCPVYQNCQANCDWEEEGNEIFVQCDDGHEDNFPSEDYRFYDIRFERILESVADNLGMSLSAFDSAERPRYVSGVLKEGFNIYLIVSPADYTKAVNEICIETLQEESPALLITPEKSIKELLEIQSLFSSGNLIYTVPFTLLSERAEIKSSLETIEAIQELENQILSQHEGEHPVVYQINSNPRYILTELNHMRLLRLAKELPRHSGIRLEKIGESAFSHLFVTYPDSGGEDDRGSNLPDILFYISDTALPNGNKPVLGIVDTKSGDDANFGSEPVEGKHTEYLKRGRRESVSPDQLAHIFVILGFDGQQEISFYDEMNQRYNEKEYMVIITAEALSLIMASYLAHTVSNDLKLVHGNFQTVIYPFFNQESFINAGLSDITREVGQNQTDYDRRYQERNGLMIVTEEVVKKRLKDCVESPNEVERILDSYFYQMPTV